MANIRIEALFTAFASLAGAAADILLTKMDLISFNLPSGVTTTEAAEKLALKLTPPCNASAGCTVAYQPPGSSGRRLQTAATSFLVTRQLGAASTGSLGAPTVDTSGLATSLGVSASSLGTVEASVLSIAAVVTTVDNANSGQTAALVTPTAVASSLGLSASAFSTSTSVVGPPIPPPLASSPPPQTASPPMPLSPPASWAIVAAIIGGALAALLVVLVLYCAVGRKRGRSDRFAPAPKPAELYNL